MRWFLREPGPSAESDERSGSAEHREQQHSSVERRAKEGGEETESVLARAVIAAVGRVEQRGGLGHGLRVRTAERVWLSEGEGGRECGGREEILYTVLLHA
jgi:hypothetical protein